MEYIVEEYRTANGRKPFAEWLDDLKDHVAKTKLTARIDRAAHGNFGDWKSIAGAKGVFEMRINYGPGYRIFFSIIGQKIILLLAGSSKREQDRTITKAKEYMADYERRVGR
jgi:putative addiction module killer protein